MLGTESSRQHPMKEYRHGSCHKSLQNVGLGRPEPWPEEGRLKESGAARTKTSRTHGLSWPLRLMTAAAAVTKSPATEHMRCTNRYDPAPSPNLKQHEITFWTQ